MGNKNSGRPVRTVCRNGHEYTPENTYVSPKGSKTCRICINVSRIKSRIKLAKPKKIRVYTKRSMCGKGHEYTPENTYIVPSTGERCCRTCRLARSKIYQENNKEKIAERNKSPKYKERRKKYQEENPLANKKHCLRSDYGLDYQDWLKMIENQNNKCDICLLEMKKPTVDHNHDTGKIRSILCNQCNRALGLFKDDPQLMYNAWQYLLKHDTAVSC